MNPGRTLRSALRTLTLGVLPAWIVLRVSAEWIAHKEGLNELDDPPGWIDIGYIAADAGFLLILISSLLGWLAYRRVRAGEGGPGGTVSAAAVLVVGSLAGWLGGETGVRTVVVPTAPASTGPSGPTAASIAFRTTSLASSAQPSE